MRSVFWEPRSVTWFKLHELVSISNLESSVSGAFKSWRCFFDLVLCLMVTGSSGMGTMFTVLMLYERTRWNVFMDT